MADKEITAQIDKLRKTRPARAVAGWSDHLKSELVGVLSFLRDDLKEECRLLEQARVKGAVSIIKDRTAVSGWLELFIHQLDREGGEPSTPTVTGQLVDEWQSARTQMASVESAEHSDLTDNHGRVWVYWKGGDDALYRHDKGLAKPASMVVKPDGQLPSEQLADNPNYQLCSICTAGWPTPTTWTQEQLRPPLGDLPSERLAPSEVLTEHRPSEFGSPAAALPGPGGRCAVGNVHDEHTVRCPCGLDRTGESSSTEDYLSGASDVLPDGGAIALVSAMKSDPGADLNEQAVHDAIDKEYAHVTADPMPTVEDPFAPIPRVQLGALTMPPGGSKWTTRDLLAPVDAASLPLHLSFSQATTVNDCGAKYRMQRIAGLPQVPQWANIGGKAFHRCVEEMEREPGEYDASCWDAVFEAMTQVAEHESDMVRESFRASQQGRENYDWWRVEGAAMLQRYVDWRLGAGAGEAVLNGPSGKPMLEWETTYDVDGVAFKTIIDSAWSYQNDLTAIIRDWKTGAGTPDDRQLCTQAWGLRKAGWQGKILVQFFDARKGSFSEPFDPFERMSWDDVRYFVLSADAQRKLPILAARPSDFCGGCSVAYACPIMAQRRIKK